MAFWQWLLVVTGGFVVAIVIVVLALYWFIRRKLRKWGKALGDMFKGLGAPVLPQTVTLVPADDWTDMTPELRAKLDEASQLGMEIGGPFRVQELPSVIVHTLAAPDREVAGTVTLAPGQLVTDFVTTHEDGTAITHTTLADQGFDRPDERPMIRAPGASMAQLLERHLAERPEKLRVAVPLSGVPEEMRRAVEDEYFWRASRGGLTDREWTRHMEAQQKPGAATETAEERAQAEKMTKSIIRGQIGGFIIDKAREQLLQTTTLSAVEWEDVETRLVFVFDHADPESLAAYVMPSAIVSETDSPPPARQVPAPLRENFGRLNAVLAPDKQLPLLQEIVLSGALAQIKVDVYVAPKHASEEEE